MLEDAPMIAKEGGLKMETIEIRFGLARLSAMPGDETSARRLYQENLTLLAEFEVRASRVKYRCFRRKFELAWPHLVPHQLPLVGT